MDSKSSSSSVYDTIEQIYKGQDQIVKIITEEVKISTYINIEK